MWKSLENVFRNSSNVRKVNENERKYENRHNIVI